MLDILNKPLTFVTIILGPKKIIFSAARISSSIPFVLMAYEEYIFEQPLIYNLKVLLMSQITKLFECFYTRHTIQHAYTIFSLLPPGIHERVIGLQVETPQEHHLQQDQQTKRLLWDYIPLGYNQSSGKTYYYACGITREQLFQYQLLAMITKINCIAIVPQRVALLKASKYIYPEPSSIESITNHALLQNYIKYASECTNFDKELSCATTLEKKIRMEIIGLLLLGKEIYEQC